eukprot:1392154-Amphidinium_carterae.1
MSSFAQDILDTKRVSTIGMAPLIANAHGMTKYKPVMVESVVLAEERLRETSHDSNGVNGYGRHSLRTGGAYWLASSGMELLKIDLGKVGGVVIGGTLHRTSSFTQPQPRFGQSLKLRNPARNDG